MHIGVGWRSHKARAGTLYVRRGSLLVTGRKEKAPSHYMSVKYMNQAGTVGILRS